MATFNSVQDGIETILRSLSLFGRMGSVIAILGVMTLVLSDEIIRSWALIVGAAQHEEFIGGYRAVIRLFGFALVGLAFGLAATRYLRVGFAPSGRASARASNASDARGFREIHSELQEQRALLLQAIERSTTSSGIQFTDTERQELLEHLRATMQKQLTAEFLQAVEQQYGAGIRASTTYDVMKEEYEKTRSRLEAETANLGRRGNLNLVIGIFISLIGILFLGWSVINAPNLQAAGRDLATYYVPRTTFVVLIELFAFFFLNLYRASLNEIKYFQNELTNVEARILAIETTILSNHTDGLATIADELMKTERNFLLKMGETTVELEKEKLASGFLKENVSALSPHFQFDSGLPTFQRPSASFFIGARAR